MNCKLLRPTLAAFLVIASSLPTSRLSADTTTLVGTMPTDVSVDNKGSANISIPLQLPPARAGMGPKLALSYNSQAGNGPFGIGCSISTGYPQAITRGRTILARDGVVKGVSYTSDDKLYLDGKRLICVSGTNGQPGSVYRTEVDSFIEITAYGTGSNIEGFRAMTKDGTMYCFGMNVQDRNGTQVYTDYDGYHCSWLGLDGEVTLGTNATSWDLKWVEDRVGNYIKFNYDGDPHGISAIYYAGNRGQNIAPAFKVIFHRSQEGRPDLSATNYMAGRYDIFWDYVDQINVRLGSDADDATSNPIRAFQLNYLSNLFDDGTYKPGLLRLNEIVRTDYSGSNASTTKVTLNWGAGQTPDATPAPVQFTHSDIPAYSQSLKGDFNGDGREDLLLVSPHVHYQTSWGYHEYDLLQDTTFYIAYSGQMENLAPVEMSFGALNGYIKPNSLMAGDFNGDGRTDLVWYGYVSGQGYGWFISLSTGTGFAAPRLIFADTGAADGAGGHWDYSQALVGDFNGDGLDDLLITANFCKTGITLVGNDYSGSDETGPDDLESMMNQSSEPCASSVVTTCLPGARWIFLTDSMASGTPTFKATEISNPPTNNIPNSNQYPVSLEVVDLDNDGKADLIATRIINTYSSSSPLVNSYGGSPAGSEIHLWSLRNMGDNNGDGNFTFTVKDTGISNGPLPTTVPDASGYADPTGFHKIIGDVNGDGLPDIVYLKMSYIYDKGSGTYQIDGQWHVAISRGDGTFDEQNYVGIPAFLQIGNDTVQTFNRRPGEYIFQAADDTTNVLVGYKGFELWDAKLVDVNGDGKKDFVFYANGKGWYCLLGGYWDGMNWGFDTTHPIPLTQWPTDASALPWRCIPMDLDGNGREDLVFVGPTLNDEPKSSEPNNGASLVIWPPSINEIGTTSNNYEGLIWPLNIPNKSSIYTVLFPRTDENRIVSVTNGMGSTTSITYSVTTDASVYTPGVEVSYPIQNFTHPQTVVSDIYKDSGGSTPAHFIYQYSGSRNDLSGRGPLGFHSFVTLDTQTNIFKYQFLTQSYPMTGLTSREQTYRYWSSSGNDNFRLIASHDNTVVFDEVGGGGVSYGTVYPFISRAVELRYEDSNNAHFSFSAASANSQSESLFSAARPAGAHTTITAESLFDTQSSVQTTLPGSYNPSDRSADWSQAGQNAVTGVPNYADFVALTFPCQIASGNLTQLKTDYGDGFTETVNTSFLNLDGMPGLVGSVATTVTSLSFGTESAPTKSYTYASINGVQTPLVQTETIATGNQALDTTTTHAYDSLGRVTATTLTGYNNPGDLQHIGSYTLAQATSFDPTWDLPTTTLDTYSHATITSYHSTLGKPVSVTDVNGAQVTTTYDALGRATDVTDVLKGLSTDTSYIWDSSQTVTPPDGVGGLTLTSVFATTTTATAKPTVTAYYDRLGRVIRTIKNGFNGQQTVTDTVYNVLGQVVAVSNPYPSGGTVYWTKTTYDPLGRVVSATAPNGTITTNTYMGRLTKVAVQATDRDEQDNVTYVDAKGRTIAVWNADHLPSTSLVSGSDAAYTADVSTASVAYGLDGFGRMRTTTIKDQSQSITASYDELSHQIELNDPDKGDWHYINNALGQVVSQTDANGNVTTATFDQLNRPLTRTTTEPNSGPVEYANWYYYDNTETIALGYPHLVDSSNRGWICAPQRDEAITVNAPGYGPSQTTNVHYYDNKGRSAIDLSLVDDKWFYTTTDYDAYSRIAQVHHYWRPVGYDSLSDQPYNWQDYGLLYSYDGASYLIGMTDTLGKTWWEAWMGSEGDNGYDYLDRPVKFRKGSGYWTVRTYDPKDNLLIAIDTGGGAIQSLGFQYDGLGNLASRSNGQKSENFTYDNLNRLTSSSITGSTSYYSNGNIKNKTSIDGTTSPDFVYSSSKPHAVATAFGYSMNYDANGNLLTRSGNSHTWATAWAGFDKPRWLAQDNSGNEFVYNANRSRVLELDFDQMTDGAPSHYTRKRLYAQGPAVELEYRNTASSGASWTQDKVRCYIAGPDGTAGAMEFTPAAPTASAWTGLVYHTDHLGSVEGITAYGDTSSAYVSDSAGRTGRYSYDAWGQRRNADTWSGVPTTTAHGGRDDLTPKGFTGHEMLDALGLVHMNGRIYDPLLGRFLSADLGVQFPSSAQSYNRYSYVRNNPLTTVDPTGFQEDEKKKEQDKQNDQEQKDKDKQNDKTKKDTDASTAADQASTTSADNSQTTTQPTKDKADNDKVDAKSDKGRVDSAPPQNQATAQGSQKNSNTTNTTTNNAPNSVTSSTPTKLTVDVKINGTIDPTTWKVDLKGTTISANGVIEAGNVVVNLDKSSFNVSGSYDPKTGVASVQLAQTDGSDIIVHVYKFGAALKDVNISATVSNISGDKTHVDQASVSWSSTMGAYVGGNVVGPRGYGSFNTTVSNTDINSALGKIFMDYMTPKLPHIGPSGK